MSAKIYLKLPTQPRRILVEEINLNTRLMELRRCRFPRTLDWRNENLVFIYCGMPVGDNETLAQHGVISDSTLHVVERAYVPENHQVDTDMSYEEAKNLCGLYMFVLQKITRPDIMKKVYTAYPEFYDNLGAYSILRDPVLVQALRSEENIDNIVRMYPVLLEAAPYLQKLLQEANISSEAALSEEQSSESESPPTAAVVPNIISREQLLLAIRNVARRNVRRLSTSLNATPRVIVEPIPQLPPRHESPHPNSMQYEVTRNRLFGTSSIVNPMPSASIQQQEPPPSPGGEAAARFASQLRVMHEMGLRNESFNLQALILNDGNLEAAILLVSMSK